MKKARYISLSVIFLLVVAMNSYSQKNFSFHGGFSVPMSDFANEDIGGATLGCTVGVYSAATVKVAPAVSHIRLYCWSLLRMSNIEV